MVASSCASIRSRALAVEFDTADSTFPCGTANRVRVTMSCLMNKHNHGKEDGRVTEVIENIHAEQLAYAVRPCDYASETQAKAVRANWQCVTPLLIQFIL